MRNVITDVVRFEELLRNVPTGDKIAASNWLAIRLLEINRCWPAWAVLARAEYMIFTFSLVKEYCLLVHRHSSELPSKCASPKWFETYDVLLGLVDGLDRSHNKMCAGNGPTVEEFQKLKYLTPRVPSISLAYAGLRTSGDVPLPSFSNATRELKRIKCNIRTIAQVLWSLHPSLEMTVDHAVLLGAIERHSAVIARRVCIPEHRVLGYGRYFPIGFRCSLRFE